MSFFCTDQNSSAARKRVVAVDTDTDSTKQQALQAGRTFTFRPHNLLIYLLNETLKAPGAPPRTLIAILILRS